MTSRRRVAVRGAVVGAMAFASVALGLAPDAHADDPSGRWSDPAPQAIDGEQSPVGYLTRDQPLTGTAEHSAGIEQVTFSLVTDGASSPAEACSAAVTAPPSVQPGGGRARVDFAFDVTFPCNRRYLVRATVQPRRTLGHGVSNPLVLDLVLLVAVPPPDVTGLRAVPERGEGIRLDWSEVAPRPADLDGYEIRRDDGDGAVTLSTVTSGTTFFDDTVRDGRAHRYEVRAVRPGPEPGTAVYSSGTAEVTAEMPASPTATTARGAAPTAGARAGTTRVTVRSRTTRPRPGVPTTIDSGFVERLPFEVPPTTGLASGTSVARLDDDGSGDRQTLALIAGGLLALVSAGLLRFLAIAARD